MQLLGYTFFDSKFSNILAHPFCCIELFDELEFYIRNDTVTKVLSLSRKCLLDEEFAEDPAYSDWSADKVSSRSIPDHTKPIVNELYASSPPFF